MRKNRLNYVPKVTALGGAVMVTVTAAALLLAEPPAVAAEPAVKAHSFAIDVPDVMECDGPKSARVALRGSVDGEDAADAQWFVNNVEIQKLDGIEGELYTSLYLGKNDIELRLGQERLVKTVEVVDTTGPEISVSFFDEEGNELTKVSRDDSKKVVLRYSALDICDSENTQVHANTFGHVVESGGKIRMKGKHNAIMAEVQAYDSDRNFTNLMVTLPIEG